MKRTKTDSTFESDLSDGSLSDASDRRSSSNKPTASTAGENKSGRPGARVNSGMISSSEEGELQEDNPPPPRPAAVNKGGAKDSRAKKKDDDEMLSDSDLSSDNEPVRAKKGQSVSSSRSTGGTKGPVRSQTKPAGRPSRKRPASQSNSDLSDSDSEDEKPARRVNKRGAPSSQPEKPSGEGDEELDGYGSDLIGDDEDRSHLMGLPEVEREAILTERYEKRKEAQERRDLGRKLKQQNKTFQQVTRAAKEETKKTKSTSDLSSSDEEIKSAPRSRRKATSSKDFLPPDSSSDEAVSKTKKAEVSSSEEEFGTRPKRAQQSAQTRKTVNSDSSDFSDTKPTVATATKKKALAASESDFSLSDSDGERTKSKIQSKPKPAVKPKSSKKIDSDSSEISGFGSSEKKPAFTGKKEKPSRAADSDTSSLGSSDDEDRAVQRRKENLRKSAKGRGALHDGDDDDDEDQFAMSSDEDGIEKKKKPVITEEYEEDTKEPELGDLNLARIPRIFLEKWVNEPYFKTAVCGSYVRLGIGNNSRGVPIYRICRIADVIPYRLHYRLGKQTCNKALVLEHGKSKRHFRMDSISNHRFNTQEFQQWLLRMKDERLKLPSPTILRQRHTEVKEVVAGHSYTEAEIAQMIDEGVVSGKSLKNMGRSKTNLETELELAKETGDHDKIELIEKKLAQFRAVVVQKKQVETKGKKWLQINQKNSNTNFHVDVNHRDKVLKEEEKRIAEGRVDSFARRPTRPKILWVTKPTETEQGAEESKENEEPKENDNATSSKDKEKPAEEPAGLAFQKITGLQPPPLFSNPVALLEAVYDHDDFRSSPIRSTQSSSDPKRHEISKQSDPSKRQGLSLKEYLARARAHHGGEA